jgi:hypothetical protein
VGTLERARRDLKVAPSKVSRSAPASVPGLCANARSHRELRNGSTTEHGFGRRVPVGSRSGSIHPHEWTAIRMDVRAILL